MGLICKTAAVLQVVVLVLVGVQAEGELFPKGQWGQIQKFELKEQVNYENFLVAAGVSEALREKDSNTRTWLEISENSNRGKIRVLGLSKETETNFVFGQPFEEHHRDGRRCQSVVNEVDSKWIHTKDCEGQKFEITREFKGQDLVSTFTTNGVTATQTFRKV